MGVIAIIGDMKPEQGANPPVQKDTVPHKEPTLRAESLAIKDVPTLVSLDTMMSSKRVMDELAKGEKLTQQAVSSLVSHVADDLRSQGVHLSSEDIRAIEKRTSGESEEAVKPKIPDSKHMHRDRVSTNTKIDLNEYQKVLDDFSKNYGINKGAWNTISGILITTDLTGQALNAAVRAKVESGKGWKELSEKFSEISNEDLKLKEKTPAEVGEYIKDAVWKPKEDHSGDFAIARKVA
jgi:hypothetical protein